MGNQFRTAILLGLLTGLIVWIGRLFGGPQGMVLAFVFAMIMNFTSYWFSDKIVLAMYRGRELSPKEAPELHQMVHELATQGGLPMPKIYVVPNQTPNAFATGRNPHKAVVAVTEGILKVLSPNELRGVLAHELSHVKNRDILIGSIAATLAGVIMMLASMARWTAIFGGFGGQDEDSGGGIISLLLVSILAPLAAVIIQMAISRSREFLADATGARIAKDPEGLARALEKLSYASKKIPMTNAKPQTAHLFIVNPLTGKGLMNLFSTHPPMEERIRRLRSLQVY